MPETTTSPRTPWWVLATGLALLVLVFLGDYALPGAVSGTASHVVVVLLGVWAATFVIAWRRRLQADVEQRQRAEDAARAELEILRRALDQTSIVAFTDARGVITRANDKFCEISGYSREELIGRTHAVVNSGLHPREFFVDLWSTISAGSIWRGEIRNRAKDGSFYWVDTTIIPVLGAAGSPVRYVALRNDITARKAAEAELLNQAALRRLGEMAAVVAHEVKNPLAGIAGVLEVLRSRTPEGSDDRQILGETLERIDGLDSMVQDLLLFARPRPPQLQRLPLASLARETAARLGRDPQWQGVTVRVEGDEPLVQADSDQLGAALLNLLINSAQAMGGQGLIEVRVSTERGLARLAVRDHGPGIPAEQLERVFEPFHTTKSRGTGLGLAIARRVIEAHGGALSAGQAPGGGALMEMTLRLA